MMDMAQLLRMTSRDDMAQFLRMTSSDGYGPVSKDNTIEEGEYYENIMTHNFLL